MEKYIREKKDIQKKLLQIIDCESNIEMQTNMQNLIEYLTTANIFQNRHEFKLLCYTILKISNNHHRTPTFINKIEQILLSIKDQIKQTFSNQEILNIFKSNKRILLFLLKEKILIPDHSITEILSSKKYKRANYLVYLFNQLETLLDDEQREQFKDQICTQLDISAENENFSQIFEEKQQIGENSSYICELIRNDSIDEFVVYVNQTNYKLLSTIKPSAFETNNFLLKNRPSLIEYAAFFGSIQILKFLALNGVELKPSLWLYVIHSGNAELIHYLEEKQIKPIYESFQGCLNEALKCHNFSVTDYIIDNLFVAKKDEKIDFSKCVKYMNFCYFPENFDEPVSFFYLCKYDYFEIVNNIIQSKELQNETITYEINKKKFFFNQV